MIDSSKKRNRQLAFELQNLHGCEKCSNSIKTVQKNNNNKFCRSTKGVQT